MIGALAVLGWLVGSWDRGRASAPANRDTTTTVTGTASADAAERIYESDGKVRALASDGSTVFFSADDAVRQAGADGAPSVFAGTEPLYPATALAADQETVVWSDGECMKGYESREIVIASRSNPADRRVVPHNGLWCTMSIALDQHYIYWLDADLLYVMVMRLPRDHQAKATPEVILDTEKMGAAADALHAKDAIAEHLTVFQDWIYFSVGNRVVRIPKKGGPGPLQIVADAGAELFEYVVDSTGLYMTVAQGDSDGLLIKADDAGGGARVIARLDHRPHDLAIRDGKLWWFLTDPSPDAIASTSLAGGAPITERSARGDATGGLLFVDKVMYWTTGDSSGALWRAPVP